MYVETDTRGQVIIQDLTTSEASFIQNCICTYLASQTLDKRTDAFFKNLKQQLDTCTKNG